MEAELKELTRTVKSIETSTSKATDFNGAVNRRPPSVTGSGETIGIDRLLHIAVSRIPLDEKYNEEWMKEKNPGENHENWGNGKNCGNSKINKSRQTKSTL